MKKLALRVALVDSPEHSMTIEVDLDELEIDDAKKRERREAQVLRDLVFARFDASTSENDRR